MWNRDTKWTNAGGKMALKRDAALLQISDMWKARYLWSTIKKNAAKRGGQYSEYQWGS